MGIVFVDAAIIISFGLYGDDRDKEHDCQCCVFCPQSATNLSMSSGKGAKERSLNSKYAAWAADQISTKYKVSSPKAVIVTEPDLPTTMF